MARYGFNFCDKVLVPVAFSLKNANNEGDFFTGLPADCAAADDISHQLGDPAEASYAEALTFIRTGACSARLRANARAMRLRVAGPRQTGFAAAPQRPVTRAGTSGYRALPACARSRAFSINRLERIRIASPFLVRSFDPPIDQAHGKQ